MQKKNQQKSKVLVTLTHRPETTCPSFPTTASRGRRRFVTATPLGSTTRPINDWLSACRSPCGLVSQMIMTLLVVDCGSRGMTPRHFHQGGTQWKQVTILPGADKMGRFYHDCKSDPTASNMVTRLRCINLYINIHFLRMIIQPCFRCALTLVTLASSLPRGGWDCKSELPHRNKVIVKQ